MCLNIWMDKWLNLEAVVQTCYVKKMFLEIWQNSLESTCARVSVLIKLLAFLRRTPLVAASLDWVMHDRDMFRTLSNNWEGVFLQNPPSEMFDRVLNMPLHDYIYKRYVRAWRRELWNKSFIERERERESN